MFTLNKLEFDIKNRFKHVNPIFFSLIDSHNDNNYISDQNF